MALSLEEILKQQSGETIELEDNIDINSGSTFTLDEIINSKPSTISQPEKKSSDIDESLESEAEDNSLEFYNEVLARIPNSNKTYSATNIVISYPYQKRKTTNHNKNKRRRVRPAI